MPKKSSLLTGKWRWNGIQIKIPTMPRQHQKCLRTLAIPMTFLVILWNAGSMILVCLEEWNSVPILPDRINNMDRLPQALVVIVNRDMLPTKNSEIFSHIFLGSVFLAVVVTEVLVRLPSPAAAARAQTEKTSRWRQLQVLTHRGARWPAKKPSFAMSMEPSARFLKIMSPGETRKKLPKQPRQPSIPLRLSILRHQFLGVPFPIIHSPLC